MEYTKQALTLAQQIETLKKRGLIIDDEAEAIIKDIKVLLAKYPVVAPATMGFPIDWQNEPLWQL